MKANHAGRVPLTLPKLLRHRFISVAVFCYAVLLASLVFISLKEESATTLLGQVEGPVSVSQTVQIPQVLFTEVSEASGILFNHSSGNFGNYYVPEVMGHGAAFLDYDNDGDQDLMIVNSSNWPFHESSRGPNQPKHAFLKNDGRGHFTDATAEVGLGFTSYGMGVCCGDIDNDGFIDLYITGYEGSFLFRNENGKAFSDVTQAAGVGAQGLCTSAAFLDYDRDGLLDLFVCRYAQWSPEIERELDGNLNIKNRTFYRGPQLLRGDFCSLYKNVDGTRFQDVSKPAGIQVCDSFGRPSAKALGVAVQDFNEDGWPDMAVANDTVPGFLFQNNRDGTFAEVGNLVGTATDVNGESRAGMGIAAGDYRNDGSIALVVTNFTNEMVGLYLKPKNQAELFIDVATLDGIGSDTREPVSWGVCFFDYDLDGWLDLFIANGHLAPNYEERSSAPYAQSALLYWNGGPNFLHRYFWNVTVRESGSDLFLPIVGRGVAYADVDGDDDLDLFVTTNNARSRLFRNERETGASFFRLSLEGQKSNRSAIGAKVRLRSGKLLQRREVVSGSSYLCQNELPVTFGLAKAAKVDELEILWPSGEHERFHDLEVNGTFRAVEGTGQIKRVVPATP